MRPTAIIAAVHLALALLAFDPMPHPGGDNGGYFALGRSLLEGGYRDVFDPAEPRHLVYPPVFPALWAAALMLGIRSVVAFKLIIIAFSVGAVALTHRWLLRRMRPRAAHGVALLVAISPGVVNLSHWELSDVPFWFFTAAALFGFERMRSVDSARFGAGAAAVVLAYFTRLAALPLAAAAALTLLWHRQWRRFAILLVVLVPLAAAWHARSAAHGGIGLGGAVTVTDPYTPDAAPAASTANVLAQRVEGNVVAYTTRHLPRLLVWYRAPRLALLSLLLLALAALGWFLRLRRSRELPEFFFAAYALLLLAWPPQWSADRLLLPIYPLILAYAADGLRVATGALRPRLVPTVLRIAFLCAAAATLPGLLLNVRYGISCTYYFFTDEPYPCMARPIRDFYAAAEFAAEGMPPDAVVLSRNPRLFYMLSGRQGRSFPLSSDPERLFRAAEAAGAEFVVVDYMTDLSNRYVIPALNARAGDVCVYATLGAGRATIFRLRSEGMAGEESADGGIRFCQAQETAQ